MDSMCTTRWSLCRVPGGSHVGSQVYPMQVPKWNPCGLPSGPHARALYKSAPCRVPGLPHAGFKVCPLQSPRFAHAGSQVCPIQIRSERYAESPVGPRTDPKSQNGRIWALMNFDMSFGVHLDPYGAHGRRSLTKGWSGGEAPREKNGPAQALQS